MTATESISKDALIQAIHEMPAEGLTMPALFDHLLFQFKIENWPVKTGSVKAKVPPKKGGKKFDYTAYRKRILTIGTWSESDIAPIEEARQSLHNWQPQTW